MSHTIAIVGGAIKIDGQPYQKGDLDADYIPLSAPDTLRVRWKYQLDRTILTAPYGQIVDPRPDAPAEFFESMEDLITYIDNNFFVDAPVIGGAYGTVITVDTYEDMLAVLDGYMVASSNTPINFRVLVDGNKGQENTLYNYYPHAVSPALMWMAAVKEEI